MRVYRITEKNGNTFIEKDISTIQQILTELYWNDKITIQPVDMTDKQYSNLPEREE